METSGRRGRRRSAMGTQWLLCGGLLLWSLLHHLVAADVSTEPILLFERIEADVARSAGSHLQLTETGEHFLNGLHAPFAIVAAVGPTRSGKSFLLNQLLREMHLNAEESSVQENRNLISNPALPFRVGPGVTSYTHGLWIWPRPVMLSGVQTYLVDSEGLHGVQSVQSEAYEVALFVHSAMLASSIVYNTWTPLDAEDVRTLKGLAAFSRLFMMDVAAFGRPDSTPEDLDPPNLHWTVQNFNKYSLEKAGWTAEEFLDQLIKKDSFLEDANVDVRFLKHQFGAMNLIPMSRPSDDDEKMAGVTDELQWSDFKADYRADVHSLYRSMASHIRPKRLKGRALNGRELVQLIKRWDQEATIQIPEHTSWHKAVALKMEHEARRLLRAFDSAASALPINSNITYSAYARSLSKIYDEQRSRMKAVVENLGEDPEAVLELTYLERELDKRLEVWTDKFISWAEKEIRISADMVNDELQKWLVVVHNDRRLCNKWWSKNSLEQYLEKKIRRERERTLHTVRAYLPGNYSEAKLKHLVDFGTLDSYNQRGEVATLEQQILLTYASCPSVVERLVDISCDTVAKHRGAFLTAGAGIVVAMVVRCRVFLAVQLTIFLQAVWEGLQELIARILDRFLSWVEYTTLALIFAYVLWLASQPIILGRDLDTLRYDIAGIKAEVADARTSMADMFRGMAALALTVGGAACCAWIFWASYIQNRPSRVRLPDRRI
ncbi:hypothetical protein HDU85_002998 [Gaertneriomyces sp. JEL0708]|nr:hypothetical protein HDU85_002998 [Gaertneriomyces sp. JEL0708]